MQFIYTLIIPMIVVILALPVSLFFSIRNQKKYLDEDVILRRLGLFYIGYRNETIYWECFTFLRHTILIITIYMLRKEDEMHTVRKFAYVISLLES